MPGLIGKKIGMTSVFNKAGSNIPCTVIKLGPCSVVQKKTQEVDGYDALQLAFSDVSEKNYGQALKGHFKKAGVSLKRKLKEFTGFQSDIALGDELRVDIFKEGDFVDVSANSKGKGFQGVVKRHGFAGVGQATHGQHNRLRAPGSIGAASYPARVFKGMKMAGRTGGEKVKVQNLLVVKVLLEKDLIVVKGAVPGHRGCYVIVEK